MKKSLLLLLFPVLFWSCIGDDFIDDIINDSYEIRIRNPISTGSIHVNSFYQFKALVLDKAGNRLDSLTFQWSADPPNAIDIQQDGTIQALVAGEASVIVKTISLQENIETSTNFVILAPPVSETTTSTSNTATTTTDTTTSTSDTSTATTDTATSTSDTATSTSDTSTATSDSSTSTSDTTSSTTDTTTSTNTDNGDNNGDEDNTNGGTDDGIVVAPQFFEGQIRTTSSYALEGNFRLEHNGTQLILSINDSYRASSSLPGLYLYLTNNPNSPEDGYEVGAVSVFSGAHSYTLPASIGLMDYKYLLYWCKPFRVKVGDAQIFD